mmetsp:Transcript_28045/g.39552  ORF Transcript_28045/g.39552 Transcript_28045/m.39552 type:complete len:290 (+) Transcript_28045:40-909(+)
MGSSSSKSHSHHTATEQPVEEQKVIPKLNASSHLLSDEDIEMLCDALPGKEFCEKWTLLYNSDKHGKSYNRFCFHVTGRGETLVIIKDTKGNIFGGFAQTWKDKHPKFYGTHHNFVFTLHPSKKVFKPTGYNDHFQYLNVATETLYNGVAMGGQMSFFTWCINDDFETGHTRGNPSSTYGCPPLSGGDAFEVDYVEVWEVREPQGTHEQEMIQKKKYKSSALDEEYSADKQIGSWLGKEYSDFDAAEEKGKKKKPSPADLEALYLMGKEPDAHREEREQQQAKEESKST